MPFYVLVNKQLTAIFTFSYAPCFDVNYVPFRFESSRLLYYLIELPQRLVTFVDER